jgi:hypothetical protein
MAAVAALGVAADLATMAGPAAVFFDFNEPNARINGDDGESGGTGEDGGGKAEIPFCLEVV